MGDSEGTVTVPAAPAPAVDSQENLNCEAQKPSIDILKEAKSSENIAIAEKESSSLEPLDISSTKVDEESVKKQPAEDEVKEVKKPQQAEVEKKTVEQLSDKVDAKQDNTKKHEQSEENLLKQKEKQSLKNKSDIFSLSNKDNLPSTIFSVGGVPSKTIHKSDSLNTNSTASATSSETSTSSKQSHLRNPLTGFGVSSNDEFKNKPSKRKDGNPLLGVGYKDDEEFFNSQPSQRIPPGGYSQGLW